jgi:predicted dehydrogenase
LNYYDSATAMLEREDLDIVAVCVRGPFHHAVTMEVLSAHPKAIFLEKPPSCSLEEMDAMTEASKAKDIPIVVSYSRHWSPKVLRMQELIEGGLIGEVRKVVGYVGGSFLSFASHATDLICQFAGYDPVAVTAVGGAENADPRSDPPAGYEREPTLDGLMIEYASGHLGFQVGTEGEYGGFYADIFGTEGYARAGIYTASFAKNKKGEPFDLERLGMTKDASVFTVAYDQIANHLNGGPLPHCADVRWRAVNEIGFAGIESALAHRRITLPNQNRSRKIYANG